MICAFYFTAVKYLLILCYCSGFPSMLVCFGHIFHSELLLYFSVLWLLSLRATTVLLSSCSILLSSFVSSLVHSSVCFRPSSSSLCLSHLLLHSSVYFRSSSSSLCLWKLLSLSILICFISSCRYTNFSRKLVTVAVSASTSSELTIFPSKGLGLPYTTFSLSPRFSSLIVFALPIVSQLSGQSFNRWQIDPHDRHFKTRPSTPDGLIFFRVTPLSFKSLVLSIQSVPLLFSLFPYFLKGKVGFSSCLLQVFISFETSR